MTDTRPPERPRILVANDDGIFSPGIKALALALADLGDVVVVAPDDFQLHEWLFVTDTVDAVYRSAAYQPVALVDELSEELGNGPVAPGALTSQQQHGEDSSSSSANTLYRKRRPLLLNITVEDTLLAGGGTDGGNGGSSSSFRGRGSNRYSRLGR